MVFQSHGGLAPGAGEWVHMERIQEILSCLNKKEGLTVIIVKPVMNIVRLAEKVIHTGDEALSDSLQ